MQCSFKTQFSDVTEAMTQGCKDFDLEVKVDELNWRVALKKKKSKKKRFHGRRPHCAGIATSHGNAAPPVVRLQDDQQYGKNDDDADDDDSDHRPGAWKEGGEGEMEQLKR